MCISIDIRWIVLVIKILDKLIIKWNSLMSFQPHTNNKKLQENLRRHGDEVPPLIQVNNDRSVNNSPMGSLKSSMVRSQYIYDSSEKVHHPNRFQQGFRNENFHLWEDRDAGVYMSPIVQKELHWMFSGDQASKKEQRYFKKNPRSNRQRSQQPTGNQIEAYSFPEMPTRAFNPAQYFPSQTKTEQQIDHSVDRKELNLYSSALQILNKAISPEYSQAQSAWLKQKPSEQLLACLMTNSQKLGFYLHYIQQQSIQKNSKQVKENNDMLSFLLIKLLSRKNHKGQIVKPQMYLNQFGIKIDFQPSSDSKLNQETIQELKENIRKKDSQIVKVRQHYDEIVYNYAQAMLNIKTNSLFQEKQKDNNRSQSNHLRNNKQMRLMRKTTFGYNTYRNSKDSDQNQFINSTL